MGRLSTHVLDTARGRPAEGVDIELFRLDPGRAAQRVASMRTNSEGRTAEPLIEEGRLEIGFYELVFAIGPYFRKEGVVGPEPAFLESVPIRFHVGDPDKSYHIPLVCSPWSYATYRGS